MHKAHAMVLNPRKGCELQTGAELEVSAGGCRQRDKWFGMVLFALERVGDAGGDCVQAQGTPLLGQVCRRPVGTLKGSSIQRVLLPVWSSRGGSWGVGY